MTDLDMIAATLKVAGYPCTPPRVFLNRVCAAVGPRDGLDDVDLALRRRRICAATLKAVGSPIEADAIYSDVFVKAKSLQSA